MKKIITAFVFCFLCGECFSQAGEWVWIKGDSVPNQPGNFGVQGVPSPTNNPPSLYEPCEWTDLNGNFWLFGGKPDFSVNSYGDLWKYDPITNEWTWIKGSGIINDAGNYGVQGVSASTNNPPSRGFAWASWTDNQGNFWMFGGTSNGASLNDLWKYDPLTNEWIWMKGSNQPGQTGIYGTQGIPSPANTPGARAEIVADWTDNGGDLWLFGGQWVQTTQNLNDLWRYSISTNEWTWMKGSQILDQSGVYGTLGIENANNTPGARMSYSRWRDNGGNLWLFAGRNLTNTSNFNDMWRYNPSTNNWAWMGGNNTPNAQGVYGIQCTPSVLSMPGSRYENRSCWTDQNGNFWFFGGMGNAGVFNDLWTYNVSANEWTWVSGDSTGTGSSGHWGMLGVSSPFNKPSGRGGSVGWSDNNSHLYIFGGWGHYNDLWKYTIDTNCIPTSIEENNLPKADELLVFPNPTNSSLTISFQSSEKQTIDLRIYNTLGKQIYFAKQEIAKGKFEKEISVEKLSGGIYFLQLKTKDGMISKKVIVNHP